MLAELSLLQFHPLEGGAVLWTEGPAAVERAGDRAWKARALGLARPMRAALGGAGSEGSQAEGRPLSRGRDGWARFELAPGKTVPLRL